MLEEYKKILDKLNSIKSLSPSLNKKIFLNLLINKENFKNLKDSLNLIENLEICNVCKNIKTINKKCAHFNKVKKIIITEKIEDSIELLDNIYEDEKLFSLDFNNKSDYLNFEKMNNFFEKINSIIFVETKEIIISLPPSIESNIISDYLKKKLFLNKINIKTLPFGISFNTNIKTIDKKTMRKAMDKSEKN